MANEFVIKNGFRSQGNSEVTGSLNITGGITGSISGSIVAPGSISQIIFNNAGVLAGANNVYFRTTGRLGIGTDSPTARLAITGSSSDLLFRLSSPSNSDILVVSGSGAVGLGTSTPSSLYALDIVGDTRLQGGSVYKYFGFDYFKTSIVRLIL